MLTFIIAWMIKKTREWSGVYTSSKLRILFDKSFIYFSTFCLLLSVCCRRKWQPSPMLYSRFFSPVEPFFHWSMKNFAIVYTLFSVFLSMAVFSLLFFFTRSHPIDLKRSLLHSPLHLWFMKPYNFLSMRKNFLSTRKKKRQEKNNFTGKETRRRKKTDERLKKKKKYWRIRSV